MADAFGDFRAGSVIAVEQHAEIVPECGAVGENGLTNLVEGLDGQAAGVVRCFEHERWNGGDEDGFGDAVGSVPRDVASHFTTACGVTDVDGIGELEFLDEFGEVVGVGVEVVAGPGLAGTAMAAPVVGDATVAAFGEKEHLVFEGV